MCARGGERQTEDWIAWKRRRSKVGESPRKDSAVGLSEMGYEQKRGRRGGGERIAEGTIKIGFFGEVEDEQGRGNREMAGKRCKIAYLYICI